MKILTAYYRVPMAEVRVYLLAKGSVVTVIPIEPGFRRTLNLKIFKS